MSKLCTVKTVNEIVESVLKKRGLSKAKLAEKLVDTPQNFGKRLSRHEIVSVHFVKQMSDAMNYNLFNDLSKEWEREHFSVENIVNEPESRYGNGATFDDYLEKLIEKKLKQIIRK